jgi:hypothetical protein
MRQLMPILEATYPKSLADVNKMMKPHKLRVVRGRGYYYWVSDDPQIDLKLAGMYSNNIGVYNATQLSMERWKEELKDVLDQINHPENYHMGRKMDYSKYLPKKK